MCDMLGLEEHEFSDDLLTQLNQAIADTFPVFETRALNPDELSLANRQMEFLTAFSMICLSGDGPIPVMTSLQLWSRPERATHLYQPRN